MKRQGHLGMIYVDGLGLGDVIDRPRTSTTPAPSSPAPAPAPAPRIIRSSGGSAIRLPSMPATRTEFRPPSTATQTIINKVRAASSAPPAPGAPAAAPGDGSYSSGSQSGGGGSTAPVQVVEAGGGSGIMDSIIDPLANQVMRVLPAGTTKLAARNITSGLLVAAGVLIVWTVANRTLPPPNEKVKAQA